MPRGRVQLLIKKNGEWIELKNDLYEVVLNRIPSLMYEELKA